jgi:hypothetical protein
LREKRRERQAEHRRYAGWRHRRPQQPFLTWDVVVLGPIANHSGYWWWLGHSALWVTCQVTVLTPVPVAAAVKYHQHCLLLCNVMRWYRTKLTRFLESSLFLIFFFRFKTCAHMVSVELCAITIKVLPRCFLYWVPWSTCVPWLACRCAMSKWKSTLMFYNK